MTRTGATRTPLEAVQEFVRSYNAHDKQANHATVSHEFVRYGSVTGWQPMGYESYKEIFDPFLKAFPDFHWEVTNLVPAGAWVAAEVIESATFADDYHFRPDMIIKATGKSYVCHYAIFFKVNDGLITEYHFYEDPTFATQLGIDMESIEMDT
ncbi:ester cyclase [Mycobacterium sp. Y57]|uniref:ester cyclase n=1 Tax=Mycolicibacterium xanthum TaxID=2796469 RepID=UPI001C846B1B|nr:nuclear transport factor 2 family protein [Mycolicibacterium xanthum]MBX7434456.1 ester cyclase [Mycolicibacterium xanthum]